MQSRTRRPTFAFFVVAGALAMSACGDDAPGTTGGDDDQSAAVPAPGVTSFTDGDFDGIPIPRGATEATTRTERDGAVSQSFTATSTSPQQIMDFFTDQLPALGWETVEEVRSTGTDSLAAAWVRDDERVEVSALLAQGIDDAESQFSVVLLPDRQPGESVNDADDDESDD